MTIDPIELLLYEELVEKLPWIESKVLEALMKEPEGLTRPELISNIFGRKALPNLSNDSGDRKIRKAIESLRELGIPIISRSGSAGYRIEMDPQQIWRMIVELEGRKGRLEERVYSLKSFLDELGGPHIPTLDET